MTDNFSFVMADGTNNGQHQAPATEDLKQLSIAALAAKVRKDWKKVNYAAQPYLSAMATMNNINDNYGADPGREIVLYFLSNATTWRGEVAKAVKAELKRRLK